jgi:DNA-directed RNA polymerase subunit alpha
VVNPELHLATLDSPEAKLSVEFNVEQGKGYHRAERTDGLPIGVLPVDAIFSPVRKVNYTVESTRVGQSSAGERLILEIWTDGTISPADAASQAGRLLIDQIQLFLNLGRATREPGERGPRVPVSLEVYNMPLEQLNLSVRTFNCLRRVGITKVGDLLEKDRKELLSIRNFGLKAFQEVEDQIKVLGLSPWETEEAEEEGSPK